MTKREILERFQSLSDPENAKKLEYYGIQSSDAYGIKMPVLRQLAREVGRDQQLAEELWSEGHHESKLLATLITEPKKFSLALADQWVEDIYSWDVCDQLCINTLVKTSFHWELPLRWAPQEPEFVRRCGLVMIVALRIHDKKAQDSDFEQFFPLLKTYATDPRNFVKKAVNWAIRDLGKRSVDHHAVMLELCNQLLQMNSKPASWIANDALRELHSEKVRLRLGLGE